MLVISRRIGESFIIGDDIEVTVMNITGDKVVVAVSAPKNIPITRLDYQPPTAKPPAKMPGSRPDGRH